MRIHRGGKVFYVNKDLIVYNVVTIGEAFKALTSIKKQVSESLVSKYTGNLAYSIVKYLELTSQIHDIEADLLDAKQQVINARRDIILVEIKDPDAVELAIYIEETMKKYGLEMPSMEERLIEIRK